MPVVAQLCAMGSTGSRLMAAACLAALIGALFAFEAISAIVTQSCAHPAGGANCYPWGTEGPSAELWSYDSKTNYLLSGVLPLATAGAAIIGLFTYRNALDGLSRWKVWGILALLASPYTLFLV